jgi:hypothetical protein
VVPLSVAVGVIDAGACDLVVGLCVTLEGTENGMLSWVEDATSSDVDTTTLLVEIFEGVAVSEGVGTLSVLFVELDATLVAALVGLVDKSVPEETAVESETSVPEELEDKMLDGGSSETGMLVEDGVGRELEPLLAPVGGGVTVPEDGGSMPEVVVGSSEPEELSVGSTSEVDPGSPVVTMLDGSPEERGGRGKELVGRPDGKSPVEVPGMGMTVERLSEADGIGRVLAGVSEGKRPVDVPGSAVGISPVDVTGMMVGMALGRVSTRLETTLETTLGNPVPMLGSTMMEETWLATDVSRLPTSEVTSETRLDRSEITGGRGLGVTLEAAVVGPVGPVAEGSTPDGITPVTEGTMEGRTSVTDDKIDGRTPVPEGTIDGRTSVTDDKIDGRASVTEGTIDGRTSVTDDKIDGRTPVPDGTMDGRASVTEDTIDGRTPVPEGTTDGRTSVTEDKIDGRTPVPEGTTDGRTSVTEDKIDGRTPVPEGRRTEGRIPVSDEMTAEVEMGADALLVEAPVPVVPKAVVMPTIIPVVGSVGRGSADEDPVPPVGSTIGPEEPALGTDGTMPKDSVGRTMLLGNPALGPVEEMMNGPRIVEVPVEAD